METTVIKGGFLVPKNDSHVSRWQQECQRLNHDNFTIPYALRYINEGDFVIDVGAFNGDHSVEYARKVSGNGRVFCIEPGNTAFGCLYHNVKLFQNRNAIPIKHAISDDFGLMAHIEQENLAASTCVNVELLETYHSTISACPLSWICEIYNILKVNFVKIDCQGYEYRVLCGSRSILDAFKPTMLISMNNGALNRLGDSIDSIIKLLNDLDYKWHIIQPNASLNDPMYDILAERK